MTLASRTIANAAERHDRSPGARLEDVPCGLCGSDRRLTLFQGADRGLGFPGIFSVVRCCNCGAVYTSPRPVLSDLPRYYPPEDYFGFGRCFPAPAVSRGRADAVSAVVWGYPGTRLRLPRALAWLARRVAARLPWFRVPRHRANGTLVEIGFGGGLFLQRMRRLGWRVVGLDLSEAACHHLRAEHSLFAAVSEGSTLPLRDGSVDVVWMQHVLEHVGNPRGCVREIRRVLKRGGEVAIEVPDFGSVQARLLRPAWRALELPRHLSHFTKRTLRNLLESEGFESIHVRRVLPHPAGLLLPWVPPVEGRERRFRRQWWWSSPVSIGLFAMLAPPLGGADTLFATAERAR